MDEMELERTDLIREIRPQPPGHSIECPECESNQTLFLCSIKKWLCLDCGLRFNTTE